MTSRNPRPKTRKTHCKRGHAFTDTNTITTTVGERRCRACQYAATKRYRQGSGRLTYNEYQRKWKAAKKKGSHGEDSQ